VDVNSIWIDSSMTALGFYDDRMSSPLRRGLGRDMIILGLGSGSTIAL
jgi:hypothetical protein